MQAWHGECERIDWWYDELCRHGAEIQRSKGADDRHPQPLWRGIEALYDERPDGNLRKLNLTRLPGGLN